MFLYLLYTFVLTLLLAEVGYRAYFCKKHNLPFSYSLEQWIYPELTNVINEYQKADHNILLLGGSTLLFTYESGEWSKQFPTYHFYSLAQPGHTSRDSYLKYLTLLSKGLHFDAVVFYHGINETRFNNVPPDQFKQDYSHIEFYKFVNPIFDRTQYLRWLLMRSALASHLYLAKLNLLQKLDPITGISNQSLHHSNTKFLSGPESIQTATAFKRNLALIAELAKDNHAQLIAPQYVYYLPTQAQEMAFEDHTLWNHESIDRPWPTRIWGNPDTVVLGIQMHNRKAMELKNELKIIDTSVFLRHKDYFLDICHFTPLGKQKFVELIKSSNLL